MANPMRGRMPMAMRATGQAKTKARMTPSTRPKTVITICCSGSPVLALSKVASFASLLETLPTAFSGMSKYPGSCLR